MTTEPKNELPGFKIGDAVRKKGDKGQWHGFIVGKYSTKCTPDGYAVESVYEENSVQIYPASALEPWSRPAKAVQGDKGVVSKLNNLEACVYEAVLHYKDPNYSRRSQSDVMEKLENAYDDIPALRASLTPESEGIAGKGDKCDKDPQGCWSVRCQLGKECAGKNRFEKPDLGETGDGYHTFNELYEHRHALFIALAKAYPDKAWKSREHDDGSLYEGWFIAGIETPEGQATYHLPARLYDSFKGQFMHRAPKWDGHTPDDVIKRLSTLARPQEIDVEAIKRECLVALDVNESPGCWINATIDHLASSGRLK